MVFMQYSENNGKTQHLGVCVRLMLLVDFVVFGLFTFVLFSQHSRKTIKKGDYYSGGGILVRLMVFMENPRN